MSLRMTEGVGYRVTRQIYNSVLRTHLPRKFAVFNGGVVAADNRLFDKHDYFPVYKSGLVDAIDEYVMEGDHVVEVGTGPGILTVHLTRAGAHVTTYEGAEEMVALAKQTIGIADATASVRFKHAIVGDGIDVFGVSGGATSVPPDELPDCDVVLLDCEGAEYDIIKHLTSTPRCLIVEVHPKKGKSLSELDALLVDRGYISTDVVPVSPDDDRPVVIAQRDG